MDKKDVNNLPSESSETGGEQMGEHIADTQENLLKNMNQEFVKFFSKINQKFQPSHTIGVEKKGKNNEYTKLSLTNKLLTQRSEPEIAITIQPNGKLNVHVNPYDTYDQFYFIAKDITVDQFEEEMDSIQESLKTGRMHINSIFEKKNYITNDNDLAGWEEEYTEAAPIFAQKKAEREVNEGK